MTSLHLPTRHVDIFRLAVPIILANAAVPLLGLTDTAVIGHTGTAADLGAIALGALVFSFVYWSFGFLRMGTSGFTAQAAGAGDWPQVRLAFGRAFLLGGLIGLALLLLQQPLLWLALQLLDGSAEVEAGLASYWALRIWGAPACLANYALMGTLIGLGKTRQLLWLQLLLNGVNLILDVLFVVGFGWGVGGIALGTAIAEWTCLGAGLWLVWRQLKPAAGEAFCSRRELLQGQAFFNTLKVNADIFWRTLSLLLGFAWFVNQGARFGDITLAANHILLQFISFSAFFLDGYAFALESLVGRALGAKRRDLFDRVVRVSTQIAAANAFGLMLLLLFAGPFAIAALTPLAEVQNQALQYLPYAAIYVLLAFAAFQLDGIFIGATRSRPLRNAGVLSLAIFLLLAWWWAGAYGNTGLWCAFIGFVVARAVCLGFYLNNLWAKS